MAALNRSNNKNVDFFKSSKELAVRTAEFFRVVLKKAELNTIYSAKIKNANSSILSIDEMLEEGTSIEVSKEDLINMRSKYEAIIDSLEKEWKELVAEQATFEHTKADKAFKAKLKNAECSDDVKNAVRAFFKEYKLDIAETTFESAILESIGKKVDTKTIVKSNGTKALRYDTANALKNLYGVSFEFMTEVGTIKPASIPSVLREKYAKKSNKKDKKAKKNQKKAEVK